MGLAWWVLQIGKDSSWGGRIGSQGLAEEPRRFKGKLPLTFGSSIR